MSQRAARRACKPGLKESAHKGREKRYSTATCLGEVLLSELHQLVVIDASSAHNSNAIRLSSSVRIENLLLAHTLTV